jgi:serine/threonine protein kinase
MKYYNFTSFNDYAFKSGLYELSLYKTVPNSRLADYFILFKGDLKQLVMIFDYCYVSLHDVLYYRKMAGYEWEESEILMVARMLAQQLVELAQVDVVHRDVRPANVFFAIVGIINSGQDKTASSKRAASGLLNESINGDKFYTLMNLESARMVDRHALMQDEDEDDIFTVKGSPVFNEGPAREALLREEHKANYNPYLSDIVGLKHTLLAMVNLEPANMGANHDDRVKKRPKVHELVKYMSSAECLSI